MRIAFGKKIITLTNMENEQYTSSLLTENELHNFECDIKVSESALQGFNKVLEECEDGGIYDLNDIDLRLNEYKVLSKSYSFTSNNNNEERTYTYRLYFEQKDNYTLHGLKIDDFIIKPYDYSHYYENGIVVQAKVKLTKEEMDKLNNLKDKDGYFDVIRQNISSKSIKMRFGQLLWSEHNDFFKVDLSLVEDCYDKFNKPMILFEPDMSNIKDMLAYEKNLNNELINLLLNKEIISEFEIEDIKLRAKNNLKDTYRLFYKVKDVDTFEGDN